MVENVAQTLDGELLVLLHRSFAFGKEAPSTRSNVTTPLIIRTHYV